MSSKKDKSKKILTGTFRACREKAGAGKPITKTETIPDPPEVVTGDGLALAEWERVAPLLYQAGLLSDLDVTGLAMYCKSYARHVGAEIALKEEPLIVTSATGGLVKNPLISISSMAISDMLKLGRQFGMTPASRSNVTINKTRKEKDPWDDFKKP